MDGPKKTQGRKKIEIKEIIDKNARRITFTKRRQGLFKKANELCTLCAVDVAVIVFSIGGKAFSFGSPSVASIIDRFLNQNAEPNDAISHGISQHEDSTIHELTERFQAVRKQLEEEKNKGKMAEGTKIRNDDSPIRCGFDEYINGLDSQQLGQLKMSLEKLKENVARRVDELLSEGSSNSKGLQEEEAPSTEENGNDRSTIPKDWLRL